MTIKFKPFIKLYRTFKKQLKWLLIVAICAICVITSPVLAQLPNTSNLLRNAQNFQLAGNYRRACGTLLQSLALPPQECRKLIRDEASPQLTETLPKLPESQLNATILRNLGDVLRVVGAIQNSEIILNQSLIISRKLNSNPDISATLVSLGNTKRALGKREENYNHQTNAKTAYQAALKYYQDAIAVNDEPFTNLRAKLNQLSLSVETPLNSNIANLPNEIELALNQFPATRETTYAKMDLAHSLTCLKLQQTDSISIKSHYLSPIEKTCTNSDNQLKIQQADTYSWQNIGQLLAKSVQEAKTLKDVRSQSYALGQLGELYEITQQLSSAKELTEQALRLAQSIHAWDIAYRWQWQLGRIEINQENDIENAIKNYKAAFETLQSLRKDLTALNPDIQFNFRDEVEPVYRELVELLLQPKQPNQANLKLARKVIEGLQLAELDNFLKEACSDAKPEQIDRVIDGSDVTAAAIYAIILPNKLAVIVKLPEPNKPEAEKQLYYYSQDFPGGNDDVESTLKNLLEELKQDHTSPEGKKLSAQVYDWIIRRAETELNFKNRGIKTLVFVLDGYLRNIPMAALYDNQNKQYLLENYAVALVPGLQLVSPKKQENLNILAAGVSLIQTVDGQTFAPLKQVETELKNIEQQLSSKVLLNQNFTNTNLEKLLKSNKFSVVHFATHGKFSSNPNDTFIVAWGKRINVKNMDNILRVKEENRADTTELLVLTACETAKGDPRATLGIAGVAVKAGARSTLASLWQADDELSPILIEEFYKLLKEQPKISKAEALQKAQLTVLKKSLGIPYKWAGYILVGNWQ